MTNEQEMRLVAFLGIITVVAVWELLQPRRRLQQSRFKRWLNNLALVAVNTFIVRLLLPFGATGVAIWAEEKHMGLLNSTPFSHGLDVFIAVVLLDLIIYGQHRLFHFVPLLWRLHQVHHADRDIDVTTGLRFHPIEILISMLIKFVAVLLLGAPVEAVILFEIILNGMAMFNHGNIKLPKLADATLRLLIVTPDMHRVHHSILKRETNSNYGFNISLWDRFFGSYRAQPAAGHQHMTIGLEPLQNAPTHSLLWMLRLPFIFHGGRYAHQSTASEKNI